jgi:predicted GH43/DUF377 family glycosyl hydrolase
MSAALLDKQDPSIVISRLDYPLLEPTEDYEFNGLRPGTVFPCGAAQIGEKLFVYYGAADEYVGVAWIKTVDLIRALAAKL